MGGGLGLAEGHGRGVLGWTTDSRLHSTCKVHAAQRTLLCEAAMVGCICAGLRAPCVVTTVQYLPLPLQLVACSLAVLLLRDQLFSAAGQVTCLSCVHT